MADEIKNLSEVIGLLRRLPEDTLEACATGIEIISDAVVTHARRNHPKLPAGYVAGDAGRPINEDGSERFYSRTARLVNSIAPLDVRREGMALVGGVGAGGVTEEGGLVEYAVYIELGTERAGPFPFLGPAADAVRPRAPEMMLRVVNEMLRRKVGRR